MTRKQPSRKRKNAWFIPVRGSYLPANWRGWLTYIPFIAYLIFTLLAGAASGSGSLAKAVLFIVPNWLASTVAMTWIAKHTS